MATLAPRRNQRRNTTEGFWLSVGAPSILSGRRGGLRGSGGGSLRQTTERRSLPVRVDGKFGRNSLATRREDIKPDVIRLHRHDMPGQRKRRRPPIQKIGVSFAAELHVFLPSGLLRCVYVRCMRVSCFMGRFICLPGPVRRLLRTSQ